MDTTYKNTWLNSDFKGKYLHDYLLQENLWSWPLSHAPFQWDGIGPRPSSLKLSDSGHTPLHPQKAQSETNNACQIPKPSQNTKASSMQFKPTVTKISRCIKQWAFFGCPMLWLHLNLISNAQCPMPNAPDLCFDWVNHLIIKEERSAMISSCRKGSTEKGWFLLEGSRKESYPMD